MAFTAVVNAIRAGIYVRKALQRIDGDASACVGSEIPWRANRDFVVKERLGMARARDGMAFARLRMSYARAEMVGALGRMPSACCEMPDEHLRMTSGRTAMIDVRNPKAVARSRRQRLSLYLAAGEPGIKPEAAVKWEVIGLISVTQLPQITSLASSGGKGPPIDKPFSVTSRAAGRRSPSRQSMTCSDIRKTGLPSESSCARIGTKWSWSTR
jgi:hypothetical protein